MFLGGQPYTPPKGRGPIDPQFWRFLLLVRIHTYTPYRKTTKFDVVIHMGKGLDFKESATPHLNVGPSQAYFYKTGTGGAIKYWGCPPFPSFPLPPLPCSPSFPYPLPIEVGPL